MFCNRMSMLRFNSVSICILVVAFGTLVVRSANADDKADVFDAVRKNNLKQLNALIEKGASVVEVNPVGWQPIHLASRAGNTALVRRLLDAGAAVDVAQKSPETGDDLGPRLDYDSEDFLVSLLQPGDLPLHCAARSGSVETVQLLIDSGAKVDAPSRSGYAPIYSAVKANKLNVVRALLKAGADPSKPFACDYLCCGISTEKGQLTHVAAMGGHLKTLQTLIEAGSPLASTYERIEGGTGPGQRPIDLAVVEGHVEIAKFLLNRDGADMKTELYPKTLLTGLLCTAVQVDHLSMAKLLLDAGADVNGTISFQPIAEDPAENWQPIHFVARDHDNAEMVKLLLKAGASPTATLSSGKQPLHLAALIERPNVISELLAAGASPTAKDNKGQTPIDIARKRMRTEALKLLTAEDK